MLTCGTASVSRTHRRIGQTWVHNNGNAEGQIRFIAIRRRCDVDTIEVSVLVNHGKIDQSPDKGHLGGISPSPVICIYVFPFWIRSPSCIYQLWGIIVCTYTPPTDILLFLSPNLSARNSNSCLAYLANTILTSCPHPHQLPISTPHLGGLHRPVSV
jgi:hypothetical protein